MRITTAACALLMLCGCASLPALAGQTRLIVTPWSQPAGGLQLRAQMADMPVERDGRIPLEIGVRNVSTNVVAVPLSLSGYGPFVPYIRVKDRFLGCYPLLPLLKGPTKARFYTMLHPGAEVSQFMELNARNFPKGKHELYIGVDIDTRLGTNDWKAIEIDKVAARVWRGKAPDPMGPLPLDLTSYTNAGTGSSVALLKGRSNSVFYTDMRSPLSARHYTVKKLRPEEQRLIDQLKQTIIPEVHFRDASIREVLSFVEDALEIYRPNMTNPKRIVVEPRAMTTLHREKQTEAELDLPQMDTARFAFRAVRISVWDVFEIICRTGNMTWEIAGTGIVFYPKENAVSRQQPPERNK